MSDFGANIFDDEPGPRPAPPPRAEPEPQSQPPPRATPPPARATAPVEPPRTPREEPQPEHANPWARPQRDATARTVGRGDASHPHRRTSAPRGPARTPESGRPPGRGPERHTVFRPAAPEQAADRATRQRGPQPSAPPQDAQPSSPQRAGAQQAGAATARPAAAATVRAGVAVLIDLDALQTEARAQRGELSLQRLRVALGGDRPVQHAIAFAAGGSTAPIGFELLAASADPGLAPGVRFAAAAIELLARAGSLVLAPASPWNRQLAAALRAAGHTVDLAGFDAAAAAGERIRVLGRDCLFVP